MSYNLIFNQNSQSHFNSNYSYDIDRYFFFYYFKMYISINSFLLDNFKLWFYL